MWWKIKFQVSVSYTNYFWKSSLKPSSGSFFWLLDSGLYKFSWKPPVILKNCSERRIWHILLLYIYIFLHPLRGCTGEKQLMTDKGRWNRNSEATFVKICRFTWKQTKSYISCLYNKAARKTWKKHSACVQWTLIYAFKKYGILTLN